MEHSKCFSEDHLFRGTLKSPMMLCKNMESRVQCPHYGDRCRVSSGPSGKSPSNCGPLVPDRPDQPPVDLTLESKGLLDSTRTHVLVSEEVKTDRSCCHGSPPPSCADLRWSEDKECGEQLRSRFQASTSPGCFGQL